MNFQIILIRFISWISQWYFSLFTFLIWLRREGFSFPSGGSVSSACFDWRRILEAGLTVALAARFRWDRTTGQMRNCFHLETQGEKEGWLDIVTGSKTHTSCLRYIAPVIIIPAVGGAERTCAQSICTWLIVDIPQFHFTTLYLTVAFGTYLKKGKKEKEINRVFTFCFNSGRGLLQGGPCVWSANTQTALVGCWLLVKEKKWQRLAAVGTTTGQPVSSKSVQR